MPPAVRSSPAAGLQLIASHATGGRVAAAIRDATVTGWSCGMLAAAALLLLGLVLVAARMPGRPTAITTNGR